MTPRRSKPPPPKATSRGKIDIWLSAGHHRRRHPAGRGLSHEEAGFKVIVVNVTGRFKALPLRCRRCRKASQLTANISAGRRAGVTNAQALPIGKAQAVLGFTNRAGANWLTKGGIVNAGRQLPRKVRS